MKAKQSRNLLKKARNLPIAPQVGALCYRYEKGKPQVLLVTTRETGRWIIPKGWLIDGLFPHQAAEQEAWEEAGVTGDCDCAILGRYSYLKERTGKGVILCQVDVFPVHVHNIASDFPERAERKRKWISLKKAALRVTEPDLAEILRGFKPKSH
ncbi:MAG: NUDIX hydrolase [Ruegeria sp.]